MQIMHVGSYDDEPVSVAVMDEYLARTAMQTDLTAERLHHEIYLRPAQNRAGETQNRPSPPDQKGVK